MPFIKKAKGQFTLESNYNGYFSYFKDVILFNLAGDKVMNHLMLVSIGGKFKITANNRYLLTLTHLLRYPPAARSNILKEKYGEQSIKYLSRSTLYIKNASPPHTELRLRMTLPRWVYAF